LQNHTHYPEPILTEPNHSSGLVDVWLLNGTSVIGTGSPGGTSTDWQIQ
jgi:hypothetical protein